MTDRIYTTDEKPRETVVVERDHERAPRSNTAAIVVAVIVALLILFLLLGRPFSGGGGGGSTDVNAPVPTNTTSPSQ